MPPGFGRADILKVKCGFRPADLGGGQRSLSRIQALYESGTVSQQELEQVQSAAQNAGIAYKAAQNQYNLQLEYTTITAPISGTVESRNIEVHDFASTGMPICTIASDGQIQVDFGVTERTFSNISVEKRFPLKRAEIHMRPRSRRSVPC